MCQDVVGSNKNGHQTKHIKLARLYISPYNLSTKPKYNAMDLLDSGHPATIVLITKLPSANLGYFRQSICTAVDIQNYEWIC